MKILTNIIKIASNDDVGIIFEFNNDKFKIIKFRPRATKNPFVVENTKTKEQMLIPLTNNILEQIRNGKVTDIS